MKRILSIVVLSLIIVQTGLIAQVTPKATGRQAAQRARIAEGVVSGELSRKERRELKAEQRRINRTKRRAKVDGVVTPAEKAKINRRQNRASRNIARQKHDRN